LVEHVPDIIKSAAIFEIVASSVHSIRKYPSAGMVPVRKVILGVGVDSLVLNVHPARLIGALVWLYNSIHSSDELAAVPPQATSLITTSWRLALIGAALAD
jgi:hypothetical protein